MTYKSHCWTYYSAALVIGYVDLRLLEFAQARMPLFASYSSLDMRD